MIDAIKGRELESVSFRLDRSKLAELARAFHEEDPAWHDSRAATTAGFAAVPAPPTATALADHWRKNGALALAEGAGMDAERLLHGEVSWEYRRPLHLDDELQATTTVADVSLRKGRRGGAMTFVTVETEFTDPTGELVAIRRDTMIETEAKS